MPPTAVLRTLLVLVALLSSASGVAAAAPARPGAVYLEELTWTELRDRVAAGSTTVLVPIGGTEQNGPAMALGKHNVRVRVLAGRIAERLGNAIVAPTLAYVPEGQVAPPTEHMRFPGTISVPTAAFEAVLEGAARSFRQSGFRDVVFLGDHGGYRASETRVAERLTREWSRGAGPACRVHALAEYYDAAQTGFGALLGKRGFTADEIGIHAGLADTALALAVDRSLVRVDALADAGRRGAGDGVRGDPRRATAELGDAGVALIVDASVEAIRKRLAAGQR